MPPYQPINGWTRETIIQKIEEDFTIKSEKQTNEGKTCMYRGPQAARCAVGLFIPDELYAKAHEGKSASGLVRDLPQLEKHLPLPVTTMESFQSFHDDSKDSTEDSLSTKQQLIEWVKENVSPLPSSGVPNDK